MTGRLTRLIAVHLIGNAALLGLAYYWLGVGESNAANLTLSFALILIALFGAAWLHGTSLAYFRDPEAGRLRAIPRNPGGRWLPLVLLAIVAIVIYCAAEYWNPVSADRINHTASYLTLTFQKPVRPATIESMFNKIWWVVKWIVIPLLLLPIASSVAVHGWRGFTEFGAKRKSWIYWLAIPILVVLAVWLPFRLMNWTPVMSSFSMEMTSVVARFGLAYLLFVAGCLLLAFVTSRGNPSASQPSTVLSP
jgi:hypothetical protein